VFAAHESRQASNSCFSATRVLLSSRTATATCDCGVTQPVLPARLDEYNADVNKLRRDDNRIYLISVVGVVIAVSRTSSCCMK
jgi:hypothetical protein